MTKGWKLILIIVGILLFYGLIVWVRHTGLVATKKVELEFWTVFDTSEDWQPLLDRFERNYKNKNKVKVKVNLKIFPTLESYRETLLSELAAGEGPDIFAVHNTWLPRYRDILQPVPDSLGLTPQIVRDTFVPTVGRDVIFTVPDAEVPTEEVVALPLYVDTLALIYNQKIFRQILSKAYPRPADTWTAYEDPATGRVDGLKDEVTLLSVPDPRDPGNEGFRLSGLAAGRADNISRGVDLFYLLYLQYGGADFLAGQSASKLRTMEQARSALDLLTRFSRNQRYAEYSWGPDFARGIPERELDVFVRGKVAMIFGYSYYLDEIARLLGQSARYGSQLIDINDVKVAPVPQLTNPRITDTNVTTLADYFALGVSRGSKHTLEAWSLIAALTGKQSVEQYDTATGKPPSRLDLVDAAKADPVRGVFADQLRYAVSPPIFDDTKTYFAVRHMIDSVADGKATVEEALTDFDQLLTCLLSGQSESECLIPLSAAN